MARLGYAEYTAYSAVTEPMAWGKVAPAPTEGREIARLTCTPSQSQIAIEAQVVGSVGGNDQAGVAAIVVNGAVVRVGGPLVANTWEAMRPIPLRALVNVTPGQSVTVSLRVGPRTTGQLFYTNGHSGFALFGGKSACWLDVSEDGAVASAPTAPRHMTLHGGQSNNEGQAPLPDQSVYSNRARVKNFPLNGVWRQAADPIMDLTGSIYPPFNNVNTPACGPMMSCGDELAALQANWAPAPERGIIGCAHGSTNMDQWARDLAPTTLYGSMIKRAKDALASSPPGSIIDGFIWYQGESDAVTEASALAWPDKFRQLVANVRADLQLPNLPVVMTVIGPDQTLISLPAWRTMQIVQMVMALPDRCVRVTTGDLPNNSGSADFTLTNSVITIGRRQAQALYPLLAA